MRIGRGKRNLSGLPACPPEPKNVPKDWTCWGQLHSPFRRSPPGTLADISLAIAEDAEFSRFVGTVACVSSSYQIYNEASRALDRVFFQGDRVPLTVRRDDVRLVVNTNDGDVTISLEHRDSRATVQNIRLSPREG